MPRKNRNWAVLVPKIEKYAETNTNGNLSKAAKHFGVNASMFFSNRAAHKGTVTATPTKTRKYAKRTTPTATNTALPTLNSRNVAIMICPIDNIKDVVNNLW